MLSLLAETFRQGCPEQVPFSRYALLKQMGWPTNAERYGRLSLALDRLVGTTYYTKNYYPDAQGRLVVEKSGFHLLEEYRDVTTGEAEGPSWVRWSRPISCLFPKGLKPLDLDQYRAFKSVVTQSLYRYLDMRSMDGKSSLTERVKILAYERIGLSRGYYLSQVKKKLDLAHAELRAAGFLRDARYELCANGEEEKITWALARKETRLLPARVPPAIPRKPFPHPAKAAPVIMAGNGSPADEELPLVQRWRQRKEERAG
jgi:hypothetical protein